MKSKIVNYDCYDYDYSTYWQRRQYENNAEHIVLRKLLNKESGNWFIDIGGSYGRLADTYTKRYKNCIILDYSLKTLLKNQKIIKNHFPNTSLIAADAYQMPFKKDTFDGGLMVRVLHHIQKQDECFRKVSRIIKGKGIYIQEFPNKIHIKSRIKALFSNDRSLKSEEPYQQPTTHLEGAKGDGVHFLNYHPKYIQNLLEKNNFQIIQKLGCSYLRIPILKKVLGTKILTFLERILQIIFAKTSISPSIFLKAKSLGESKETKYEKIENILACPICKSPLEFKGDTAICGKCDKQYIKKQGIWDFRIE